MNTLCYTFSTICTCFTYKNIYYNAINGVIIIIISAFSCLDFTKYMYYDVIIYEVPLHKL